MHSEISKWKSKLKKSNSRLGIIVKVGWEQLKNPYYQGFAAQLSFYFMMSLIPIMLLISQILAIVFKEDLRQIISLILETTGAQSLPGGMERFFIGGGSGTISAIFIVVALWAASKAQFALIRLANFTLTGGITTGRGFVRDRVRAYLTMVITILALVAAIGIVIYGEVAINIIFTIFHAEANASRFWYVFRWPIVVGLYFFSITFLFYVLPTNRPSIKQVLPGSIFASVGLLIVTLFYTIYANTIANYNLLYGSLATIIAMMIWFYFIGWVIILGLIIIYSYDKSVEILED